MVEILINGKTYITVTRPTYVKTLKNGCYALCSEKEAEGIVIEGEVFSIGGKIAKKQGVELREISETQHALKEKEKAEEVNNINAITFVILAQQGYIDDVTAGEHADIFAEWVPGVSYTEGDIRKQDGKLYKCAQAHTSQADWAPAATASLWINISDPAEEFPAWSQPVGAHDTYSTGDKVTYKGIKYVSTVDGNVWEPGVYGWDIVTE